METEKLKPIISFEDRTKDGIPMMMVNYKDSELCVNASLFCEQIELFNARDDNKMEVASILLSYVLKMPLNTFFKIWYSMKLTQEQFNDACDRYRKILRETEGNWKERKRRINEFRCGL